jgi:predicted site-specific integrase-resolvase
MPEAASTSVRSVAHRDRASRLGAGRPFAILGGNRRPVVILGSRRGCETLAQDVREITTVFGARLCDGCSRRPQVARLLRA